MAGALPEVCLLEAGFFFQLQCLNPFQHLSAVPHILNIETKLSTLKGELLFNFIYSLIHSTNIDEGLVIASHCPGCGMYIGW